MAFGDLLVADFQFQLVDTLYGTGQHGVWLDDKTPPSGMFDVPDTKTQDVDLPGVDGAAANPDHMGVRQIHLSVVIRQAAEATLINNLVALQTAWAPVAADADLYFQWPGIGVFGFQGRPRGMQVDLSLQRRGAIRALLRFDCPSPAMQLPA